MSLRSRWYQLRARGPETGSGGGMALVLLVGVLALLMIFGLVLDGGLKVQALDRADRIASEAARSGLQAATITSGGTADYGAVTAAVAEVLDANHVTGRSWVAGDTVHVEVTVTTPTKVLGLVGITSLTITGHGSADLTHQQ